MKPTLPICILSLPDTNTSPELWQQIAPILSAIAKQEQGNEDLYPYEKVAYSALAYAQYNASKKQWSTLWQYLLERQVLRIGDIATPPPKPKSDRPTKPPKSKIEKVAKPRKAKKKKSPIFIRFARLKHSSLRLQSFLYFANFLAYIAPLCPKAKIPLRERGRGEKIKALLSYKAKGGEYSSLKLYLPSTQSKYKMHPDVVRLLLDWSNPLRTRTRKKIESDKAKGAAKRVITAEILDSVLTDKWQDTGSISAKLNAILDQPIEFEKISKLLTNRYAAGEIYRLNGDHQVGYYSRIEATEFESQWLTLEMAYQLAKSRGCAAAKNTFRKNHRFDYAAYGLEFRRDVPEFENSLLRWRDTQS